jgi:GIY-YIG catalytic domain.
MLHRPTVYQITCETTEKKYIGITSGTLARRRAAHFSNAKNQKTIIGEAIRKYGKDAFQFETIATCFDWPSAQMLERVIILDRGALTPNGYNQAEGGVGNPGRRASPEERKKLAAHLARVRPVQKGGKQKPETIEKIRAACAGKSVAHLHTPESIAKRAATQRGRKGIPASPKTKAAVSATHKGKPKSAEQRAKMSASAKRYHASIKQLR